MCSLQIADVKLQIERSQGQDVYPSAQQMLIHQGKVLKDSMTLEENNVTENSFLVIMLTKVRDSLLQKVLVKCLCYFFVDVQVEKQLVRLFCILIAFFLVSSCIILYLDALHCLTYNNGIVIHDHFYPMLT